ncbi:Beta-lactamase domain-containing protein/ABC1 domain-containing protein/WaaY domain-containing protein [Cephalotus follicularis]|uniref:Beta-lactamase domain-containing protein/ABC1 domain-containing protein/WaaY domain-containing protein n=1 Tax=Cephalotus follicularis TaxID=3775 RepID=A0A1Q3ATG3_CEPFO|nr:Beta-lactamase domain-containing protein/ABC1 domain-containing protein/WaaY domain-containing protein [Cephalotus follicularis]
MGWGNAYKRRMKVFSVALIIYVDYKVVQQIDKWNKKNRIWERAHERNAKRVLQLVVGLDGLWVKLGQFLSTRADVLPQAYITVLKQLQDSLPPRPLQEVCRTIEKELGKPMDDLFLDFNKIPLATASISQVHRATRIDGREVVVKVQHESIKKILLEDLKNAKSIVDWIAWVDPRYDYNPMIDEWYKEFPKELDFNHEAENTRTVSRNLGCINKHDDGNCANWVDVLIPEVIESTETVLVLEYIDGIRVNDSESLEAYHVDRQKIVEGITRAYAHQIYVDGFFNGDPHPGNFLVSKEPPHRPILLDFGLTKKLSGSSKQALAKIFLASAEGDYVALLSACAEMGFKLRLDMPEQIMVLSTALFRTSTPGNEAHETVKSLEEQRNKDKKVINPVDSFPGDVVIFCKVLDLLRGLSSTMNVRIVYLDIMRPFAEYALQGNINKGPEVNGQWIYDTPVHSDVEAKLRQLLIKIANDNKILGIQVCAYKEGKVIIDTAAGVLGRYDPRPVQSDSLFPVFSVTKGITAGMLHWLVDNGKLKLDENVANIWPEFGSNNKNLIKVHHVLNHTSGLHNVMVNLRAENPLLMCDWDECLNRIAMSVPETEPGREQLYHYLSFGWLCGGIIEHASGRKFQEILEEAFIHPLKIEGELYIGIPPGVESRLATLTVDTDDLNKLSGISTRSDLPSTFNVSELATTLPSLFNMLNTRRAIIPAANGHCSARALARYYAALVDGGIVPPPHSSYSKPLLGSHPHIPKFLSEKSSKRQKGLGGKDAAAALKTKKYYKNLKKDFKDGSHGTSDSYTRLVNNGTSCVNNISSTIDNCASSDHQTKVVKIFSNPNIHEAFMGFGEYGSLVMPDGGFGLGFRIFKSQDGSIIGFGHSGMGGSRGFCDIKNRFAIAVTVNKMSFGSVTGEIVNFICSELNIPSPKEYLRFSGKGPNVEIDLERLVMN